MVNKKKILFVCYGGGHVEIVKSIIESCIDFDKFNVEVIALTVAFNEISDKRIKKYRISDFDFLFKDILSQIHDYGSELLQNNFNPNVNIPEFELKFYLGISFFELVSNLGLSEAKSIYKAKKRQSFFPVKTMIKIIDFISPDIVFTTNSPRMEAASIAAARSLNIKSIQILDLFGDDYIKPSADYIIVLNEFVKAKLQSEGVENLILPLGQPIFDKTVELVKSVNVKLIKEHLLIPQNQKVILFSPTKYYLWNHDLSLRGMGDDKIINQPIFKILENITNNFNLVVIVRPHPVYDKIEDYQQYTNSPNIRFISNDNLSLYESLGICDAVLTYISTIAVQGMVCGKAVFTYNYDDTQKYFMNSYTLSPFIYSENYDILEKNLYEHFNKLDLKGNNQFYFPGANSKIFDFLNFKVYHDLS